MFIFSKQLALIILLFGLINAGPLSKNEKNILKGEVKCSKKCSDSKNFNYQIGRSYTYDFTTKNSLQKDNGNVLNEVEISGHARITVQSNCEHVLKLENVNIKGIDKDSKDKTVKELESNNLAYAFLDGEIENVCPLADEKDWTLNVKKAILSSLQFTPKESFSNVNNVNVNEKDVIGVCDTVYDLLSSDSNQYKFNKAKKMQSCSHKISVDSAILGSSPVIADFAYSLFSTFVKNDHRCKLTIKKTGIVESVKCTEVSEGAKLFENEMIFLSEISLKFRNEDPVHYPQTTGEFYEDSLIAKKIDYNLKKENVDLSKNLKPAVDGVCESISNSTLSHKTAKEFRNLVHVMKHSSYDALKAQFNKLLAQRDQSMDAHHHNKLMNTELCCKQKLFKLYLDALISSKSDASLKLLVTDIVPNNFYLPEGSVRAELKLNSFYTSLAFLPNPTEETLRSVIPLLNLKGRHSRNALFGTTALAQNICKKRQKCEYPAIDEIANLISNKIPANCKSSSESQVVEKLKALENLPKLPETVVKKLAQCLSPADVSVNIKVSILQNMAKQNCQVVKKISKDTLMSSLENDEVRIFAYKIFRSCVENTDDAKDIEKALLGNKGELASYIYNDIQQIREKQNIKCPKMLAIKQNLQIVNLKGLEINGKSRNSVTHPLSLFFKSNLIVVNDVIYSKKSNKPISLQSEYKLKHHQIFKFGIRSETGSNILMNLANVETIIGSLTQLVKSFSSVKEDGKARLIDEWAAQVLPEFASALRDVDFYFQMNGKNLIYLGKNDQNAVVADPIVKIKLGLVSMMAINAESIYDMHFISGLSVFMSKERTFLTNLVLFDSEKVDKNKITFEMTPNAVFSELNKINLPIGKNFNSYILEKERLFTSNFGIKGTKVTSNNQIQIRFKFSQPKVDLISYQTFSKIYNGNDVKSIVAKEHNYDFCLDNILPIKKMFGFSLCAKCNEQVKGLILEKTEDSEVLITLSKEKNNNLDIRKLVIEQEKSVDKRKLVLTISDENKWPGPITMFLEVTNPIGNGWTKLDITENNLSLKAKLNDHKIYSIEAEKKTETKNKETSITAKMNLVLPGFNKPLSGLYKAKIVDDKKYHYNGEFLINDNTKLASLEFNVLDGIRRKKRSADSESILDFDYDLKVFGLSGKTLMHHKYESNIKKTSATVKSFFEYHCRKTKKLENLVVDLSSNWSKDKIIKFSMLTEIKSSNHPILNSKFDQKFAYKPSEHIENDIKIELDALGTGDERLIRLGSVYKLTKKDKKIDVDHLARIVINKFNYNREYNFIGTFDFSAKISTFDTKLKIQDLSAANEVLSASAIYKAVDVASNKYNLLIDYNCNKHGKFSWNEDISYDKKTLDVSTKIVLTVFKIDDQAPSVYTGEYNSSPKKNYFDFKLKKTNNDDVINAKFDFSKPNEALIFFVEFEKERIVDFNGKLNDKKDNLEAINLKIKSLGELKLDNSKTADGRKITYKLKTEKGYQQNAAIVYGNKIISLEINSSINDKSIIQVELFLSNPSKTLRTYHDIQSGSIAVKMPSIEVSFKQENLPSSKSLMFELKRLNLNRKFVIMAVRDNSKLALMTKLEKDGNSVYAFDSTFSLVTPSVINLKSENKIINLNVNPFGFKEDEWKIISLDFALKNDKYKHNSIIMLKKVPNNDRVFEIKSASKGQTPENKKFEHSLSVSVGNSLQNVKINLKSESEGYGLDELNYLHDFNGKDKGLGFNLKHSLKLTIKDKLVFQHDSKTKYDKIDSKLWDFTTMSEIRSSCKYLDGVKFDFKGNCNNEKTGKVELNIDYPYKNTTIAASYMGKNTLKENFKRELKIDISNSKLNYKDSYLAKLDIIYGLELHLKYNKLANTGHKLENLELRLVLLPEEYSILFVAPRGWNGHAKLAFGENITFSTNLVKRSRVLISVDSKVNLKKTDKRTGFTSVDAHTLFGFNGNLKFAEEKFQLTQNGLDYKFTSVLFNLDLNFKNSDNKNKQSFNAKLCSAKKTDECALLDLNVVRKDKEIKSQGTFKYGVGDEAINVNFDYSRQILDNGDIKGKLIGDVNGKKLTGEMNYIRKGESFVKIELPSRVFYMKRETLATGFKYTFWPNYENEKTHEHGLTFEKIVTPDTITKEFTFSHPAFKRKLKSFIKYDKKNTVLVSLDLNEDINKKLNFKFSTIKNLKTAKGSMHIYRDDKLIDFGCEQEYSLEKNNKLSTLDHLRMTNCFWVDKNNKKQIFNREILSKVELLENKKTKFSLYSKYLLEWPLISSLVEGKSIIDVEKLIATGTYLMTRQANKRQLEYNYKDKCLNLDVYDLPKESFKNSYVLNACTMNKISDKSLFKVEYLMNRLDSKKKLNKDEKFLVKLNKIEDQQLLFVLHWDPEMIGEFIIDFGEMIEKDVEKKQIILDALSSELEHKFGLLKTSLIDEFVTPIRKHRKDHIEQIIKEINPKLVPRFLNKREIKNSSLDVNTFGSIAKTLFNFKLLKSSLEDGQIEFIFTPHPTFQGTKHALKSTFQYLLKA